ncbi:hypothetical protein BSL82_09380 [Tardibacter chloracetimidivorans]|uniref:Uncharacterized protein n=1 Tax=Tardibacter chloracetimidivorans TaxID=1921510 RepID=A0A1L3ZV25_9SPHN|nr:XF1762 family protein [Tardibacter chloracetimidivorans]API59491.1 hypothetical protein BSL82_09380 [Tardibacter chloracetimidivorans]
MTIRIVPLTLREANDFVEQHHRHSARTSNDGGKYAIGLECANQLVGVAIVGRPIARLLQDGSTAELLRLCTSPAAPKGANSKLYSRAKRIWQLMGGGRFVTYTLKSESGASMRGAGATPVSDVPAARWDRPSRARTAKHIETLPKHRWQEHLPEIPA